MSRNGFSGNGHRKDKYADEFLEAVEFEEEELKAGRDENVVMLKALAGEWSVSDFLKVARWHGKHWRFVSALADKELQIHGESMLILASQMVGADLAEQIMLKARKSLARLQRMKERWDARYGANEYTEQLYVETCEDVVWHTRVSRHCYYEQVGRLLG